VIDISLDKRERKILELAHPYGTVFRTMHAAGIKREDVNALIERRLIVGDGQGGYDLTEGGRAALGVKGAASDG
jgi:hypothetical protein